MKRRFTLAILGLLGFLIICLLCIFLHADEMARDLTDRSREALTNAGISLSDVSFNGRHAILAGEVASEEVADQATGIVGDVYGVAGVVNNLTVAAPAPPPLDTTAAPAKPKTETQIKLDALLAGKTIEFESNSAVIDVANYTLLDEIAGILNQKPSSVIEIAGHTDATGDAQYNLDLSKNRANAVRQYLIGKNIDGARLKSAGYGATKPLANNDEESGKQQNRRVEFNVLEEN